MKQPPKNELAVPVGSDISDETLSRFKAFVTEARLLTPLKNPVIFKPSSDADHTNLEFSSFVDQAKPLLVQEIKATLQVHRAQLENLSRWLVPRTCDVLTAAGLSRHEVPYTRLISWMLWPAGKPELALLLQRTWLRAIGLSEVAANLKKAAEPKTEFVTSDGGRADLVMRFHAPDYILIVEAKIDSEEHVTPNNEWQTEGYPLSVRRSLGLADDTPGAMVFLTPDGREAVGKNAIVTTYETLAIVIAETLSPEELGMELRSAYSTVLTHFLTHTATGGKERVDAIREYLCNRKVDISTLKPNQILQDLAILGPLCRILRIGDY